MLNIIRFTVNNFDENTYLAVDKSTLQAAVIDPGMLYGEERQAFDKYISDNDIKLTQIILTHAHLDHCFGAIYVKNKYDVPIKAHTDDDYLAKSIKEQAARFGMAGAVNDDMVFDVPIKEGDSIFIGQSVIKVIHVPGHSKGGIALYDEEDKVAFVGDSIFEGSIGRTDLPGGDLHTLLHSLNSKILTLPDDTVLLPGHGSETTVANEKQYNPYLKM